MLYYTIRCYNEHDNDNLLTSIFVDKAKHMASPPTQSLDFRGFDSSRLLILRGGNSHIHRI